MELKSAKCVTIETKTFGAFAAILVSVLNAVEVASAVFVKAKGTSLASKRVRAILPLDTSLKNLML